MSIESCCAAEVFLVFKSRFLPGTNQLALSVRPPFGFVFVFTALRILGSQFLRGDLCPAGLVFLRACSSSDQLCLW